MIKMLRRLLVRNWELKLLSLFLALILWVSLVPEEKTFSEKTLTIPLETHNLPDDMELVEKPETTVDVTIRAPNRTIDEVTPANVFVKLNLSAASVVQQEYPLNETMVSLPPGAAVVRLSPTKVRLKLERTQEVMLDIVPTIIGQAREGYGVSKIEVNPPRVLVKGPESKVRRNEKVTTSPIDISALTSSIEVEADIILPKPELRLASSRPRVIVKIFLEEIRPPGKAEPKRKP